MFMCKDFDYLDFILCYNYVCFVFNFFFFSWRMKMKCFNVSVPSHLCFFCTSNRDELCGFLRVLCVIFDIPQY